MRSNGCCVGEVRMEVPLTWQDPSPLIRFPVMEADTDDIPPSPTPDPVTSSPFGAGTFFQRGFLDCAHEAIRFLTEEEGMSENNPVVVGLRQHLVKTTPCFTPPRSSPLSSSSQLQRGRYAPYTVSPHRNVVSGCAKREGDKLGTSLSLRGGSHQKYSATTAPFAQKMEHVIASDLISTDDLQGVLRCLESEQSDATRNPHQCASLSLSSSTSSSSVVLQRMPTDIESCAIDEGKKDDWQSRSLDDSGISEAECVELADEVDGVDAQCASVCDLVYDVDTAASADSMSVKFQDNADDSLPHSSDLSIGRGSCPTTERQAHENLPCETLMSTLNSSHYSTSGTSVLPVPVSHSISSSSTVPTTAANTVDSNPSSQLALLSSLSSGTHRLTSASADTSDPTASRIQSLASQILLLLQEEAYAQDYSDDENDDDDDDDDEDQTSDIGESDLELEEDFLDLEAEP